MFKHYPKWWYPISFWQLNWPIDFMIFRLSNAELGSTIGTLSQRLSLNRGNEHSKSGTNKSYPLLTWIHRQARDTRLTERGKFKRKQFDKSWMISGQWRTNLFSLSLSIFSKAFGLVNCDRNARDCNAMGKNYRWEADFFWIWLTDIRSIF